MVPPKPQELPLGPNDFSIPGLNQGSQNKSPAFAPRGAIVGAPQQLPPTMSTTPTLMPAPLNERAPLRISEPTTPTTSSVNRTSFTTPEQVMAAEAPC
ncbi:MAG: hypothetical protein QM811_02395 [Pirellulales bacterium]